MQTLAVILLIGLVLGAISRLAGRLFSSARFPEEVLFMGGAALILFIALGRTADNGGNLIVGAWFIVSLSFIGYLIARFALRR